MKRRGEAARDPLSHSLTGSDRSGCPRGRYRGFQTGGIGRGRRVMLSPRVRRLLSGSILVAVGLAVAQALAYLLNLVAARLLGPQTYGAFAALMSVMLIASTVALGLQAASSKRVVATPASERPSVGWGLLSTGVRTSLLLGLIAVVLSPLIAKLLRLDTIVAAVITGLIIGVFTLSGAQLGITQGAEKFGRLGSLYSSVQLCRTVGAVAGAALGHTLTGTLLGLLVGTVAGVAVGQLIVAPLVARPAAAVPDIGSETWHATHALLALFVLTNMDILLARYFLTADQAGLYAVGVLIAKVAFFLPQFIIVIAFPTMSRQQDRRSILLAAGATATIGLIVTLFVVFASSFVVAAVGGSQYRELTSEAWLFAAEGSLFAVAQVLLYGQVARGNRWAVVFLWAAVALFGLAVALGPHSSVLVIVTTALIVAAVVVVAGIISSMRAPRQEPLTLNEIGEFLEQ